MGGVNILFRAEYTFVPYPLKRPHVPSAYIHHCSLVRGASVIKAESSTYSWVLKMFRMQFHAIYFSKCHSSHLNVYDLPCFELLTRLIVPSMDSLLWYESQLQSEKSYLIPQTVEALLPK